MNEETKKKSKLIAFFLNIIILGAGFIYINKTKLAIKYFLSFLLIYFGAVYLSSLFLNAYILLISYILIAIIIVLAFILPVIYIHKNKYSNNEPYSTFLLICFIIISIPFYFFVDEVFDRLPARTFIIPTNSMAKTIEIKDQIIGYKSKIINRGDLTIFRYPKNPEIFYIKRCVAIGGDIISLKNKNLLLHPHEGNEYVKANYKKEQITKIGDKFFIVNPYKDKYSGIHNDPTVINNDVYPNELFDTMPIVVPQNEYFLMGDNRDHANDSRFIGTIPAKFIYGKTNLVYLNLNNLKRINKKIE